MNITLDRQSQPGLEAFESAVRKLPEVMECYLKVTGEHDYLLRLVGRISPISSACTISKYRRGCRASHACTRKLAMRTVTRSVSLPER